MDRKDVSERKISARLDGIDALGDASARALDGLLAPATSVIS